MLREAKEVLDQRKGESEIRSETRIDAANSHLFQLPLSFLSSSSLDSILLGPNLVDAGFGFFSGHLYAEADHWRKGESRRGQFLIASNGKEKLERDSLLYHPLHKHLDRH